MSDVHPATPMGSPPQRAGEAPGQAAFREHFARFHATYAPDVARRHAAQSWEYVSDAKRQDWDAVAQAAITAGTGRILAEAARYKAGRDKLDADCQQLAATLTRLGNSHADMRAERDRYKAERDEITGYHGELLDEVLHHAGDEFDGDEAADAIAVRYVRHLEDARAVAAEMLAALGPRPNGISNPQLAKWRERLGLEPQS